MDLPFPIIDCPPAAAMRDYTAFAKPFFNTICRFRPFWRIGVRTPKRSLKFSNVMAYRDSKPSFRCAARSAELGVAVIT